MLDYGAGSGVLALAALRLGAERAVAVDCDPLSVRMCAANAELNGLQDSLEVVLCAKDPAKVRLHSLCRPPPHSTTSAQMAAQLSVPYRQCVHGL